MPPRIVRQISEGSSMIADVRPSQDNGWHARKASGHKAMAQATLKRQACLKQQPMSVLLFHDIVRELDVSNHAFPPSKLMLCCNFWIACYV